MNYYIDKIKESIEFTWKYKFLWVFGFLIGLFGTSTNFSGNSNFNSFNRGEHSQDYNKFVDDVKDFIQTPTFWLLLLIGTFVVVVISLIGWYLLSVSKGALTEAVKKDKESKEMSLKSSWKDGQEHAMSIMMLDVTGFFINLIVGLPLIAVIIATVIFPPFLILLCCLGFFYLIYYIGWTLTYTVAHRYLVLSGAGAWDSLKVGFEVVKDKILNIILAGLVGIIPGCAWMIVVLMLIAIPGLIIVLVGFGALFVNPIVGILILVVGLIGLGFFGAVLNSPFQVFSYTYWTKMIMDWLDERSNETTTQSA